MNERQIKEATFSYEQTFLEPLDLANVDCQDIDLTISADPKCVENAGTPECETLESYLYTERWLSVLETDLTNFLSQPTFQGETARAKIREILHGLNTI